ncbi:unnamed protein product, partial [Pleuronectes platessa]
WQPSAHLTGVSFHSATRIERRQKLHVAESLSWSFNSSETVCPTACIKAFV